MIALDPVAFGDAASDLLDARLRAGNTIRFVVPTASMFPTLAPGDGVIVRGARAKELKPGDIVVVKANGSPPHWIVHRLIARRGVDAGARLVTKGDNCAAPDALWTESQICGIVAAVWRAGAPAPSDWRTRRAQWLGAWLAFVSRGQAHAASLPSGWIRRVMLKASRWLMRGSALFARGLME